MRDCGRAGQLGRDRRLTATYGLAHFGKSLFWHSGDFFLAFFLTEAAGLPPVAMGGVLAASLMISAIFDLVIGRLCARRLADAGSAARLQRQGAVLSAGAALALFATPLVAVDLRLAYALATALAFRASYSLHDLPQNALLSVATADDAARTSVAAVRVGASGLAALVLAGGVMPLIAAEAFASPDARTRLFIGLGGGMAVVAVVTADLLRRAIGVPEKTPRAARPPATPKRAQPTPQPLAPILAMIFVFLLSVPLFGKLERYFAVYGLRSPAWAAAMGGAGVVGMIAAPLLWTGPLERLPRAQAIAGISVAMLAAMIVFAFAGGRPAVAVLCAFVLGSAGGAVNLLLWAAVGDVAARADPTRVGLIHGVFTALSKTALALGALALGGLLSTIDYREDGEGLIRLMAGAPAVGAFVCVVMALLWDAAQRRPRRDIGVEPT